MTMNMQDDRARIKVFLSRVTRSQDLKGDEDIFALGFVNSLFAMELVNFVEAEFQITVDDEDLDLENFNTINHILDLVQRKILARQDGERCESVL